MNADEMFEELGYNKSYDDNYIVFSKKLFNDEVKTIVFNLNKNLIDIRTDDIFNLQVITTVLNMKELQAINEKVKELRLEKQLNKEIKSIKEK